LEAEQLSGLLVALGAGLLIGIERERRKGSGPGRSLAGARTFTLAAVTGALSQLLQQPALVIVGGVLVVLLTTVSYWRSHLEDPGVTTEMALFLTYLIGVAAIDRPMLAAAIAVIVATLLAARSYIHVFSRNVLSERELHDGLLFAGAALVVLPLLPDEPVQWMGGVSLKRIWTLVVLFMALQGAGYVALRAVGARLGLAAAGLASGFVSSTATVATMGARVRESPALLQACVSGALFSTVSTVVQMGLIAVAVHVPAFLVMMPSLLAGVIASLLCAGFSMHGHSASYQEGESRGHAFSLWHAVGFAVLLSGVTAALALANTRYGNVAVSLGAALSGFFDTHAAGASVFSLMASEQIGADAIAWPVLLALTTNTVSKIVVAFLAGGVQYAWRVAVGLLIILAALWMPSLLL
jgi:uncharacterized membrane protein (DUF4010 family)